MRVVRKHALQTGSVEFNGRLSSCIIVSVAQRVFGAWPIQSQDFLAPAALI